MSATQADDRLNAILAELTAEPDMPADVFFEVVAPAVDDLFEAGRAGEVSALLDRLRDAAPVASENPEAAVWMTYWRADAGLCVGADDLTARVALFAPHAHRRPELAWKLIEALAYHGRTAELLAFFEGAWPGYRDSEDLFDWAAAEMATAARRLVVDVRAAEGADVDAIARAIAPFAHEDDDADAATFVKRALPSASRAWKLSELRVPPSKDAEIEKYDTLLSAFRRELHGARGFSIPRALIAANEVEAMVASSLTRAAKQRLKSPPLVPTHDAMVDHAGKILQTFVGGAHRATAFLDALPAWADFLAARGLVDADSGAARVRAALLAAASLRDALAKRTHDRAAIDRFAALTGG